jgi:TRAP-type transport system periplasmic protein
VDGAESPVGTFMMHMLNEVQKYLSLDGHVYSAQLILINDRIYQSYPKDLRDLIAESGRVCSTVSRGVQVITSSLGVTEAAQRGMQVYVPTTAEKEAFKKATQGPAIEYLKKELGPAGEQWMTKLFQAIRQAEAKLGP